MQLNEILAAFKVLPPEQQDALKRETLTATKDFTWVPNEGPQTEAYNSKADMLLYGGAAGGGKGLRLHDKVLSPYGWREAQNIEVGSKLCATDGTVQDVIAVYRRGVQPLYRMCWHDGTESVVDKDHLWLGWRAGKQRKIANVKTCGEDGARIWVTEAIYQNSLTSNYRRFAIPLISQPCLFNVAGSLKGPSNFIDRSLPPYALGVLLGDGYLAEKGRVSWSKPDLFIADKVEECFSEADRPVKLHRYFRDDHCPVFYFPSDSGVKEELESFDLLGKHSIEKFIPRMYLLSSVEERWELLRGLMDTDGWVENGGRAYYGTSSPQLAEDVAHLARSLGAFVSTTDKIPNYTHKGKKLQGQRAYALYIKLSDNSQLFHLPRKKDAAHNSEPQTMAKFLDSIEPDGEEETVCFVVSNPNRLFIIEGFIVTHNSQLLLGLATQEQTRTIIFRREASQADGLIAEAKMLLGDCFNGQDNEFKWGKNKSLKFAGLKEESDWRKHAGRERDGIFFDESGEFLQSQVQSALGWNRGPEGQRCRIVLASNPPRDSTGLWMLEFFAPWLDPSFPDPAAPGELRWCYMSEDDKTIWVADSTPIPQPGKEHPIYPHSRTFIPAKLKDNPYRNNVEYLSKLQATPGAALRKQLLEGDFLVGQTDRAYQLIPTDWIREAQDRWKPTPPPGVPQCAIGVDVAQGGADKNVLASRFDGWYSALIILDGEKTPLGTDSAGWIVANRRDGAAVVIDCGGGYGAVAYTTLNDNGVTVYAYKGAEKSLRKTQDNLFGFVNKRTELYWKFREALDPSQPGGSPIMLPPDPILLADLAAPDYKLVGRNYAITTKEQLVKDLGRSCDRGDAVVLAWSQGQKAVTHANQWGTTAYGKKFVRTPQVIMGHPQVRRYSGVH